MFPQAIASIKKTILAPFLRDDSVNKYTNEKPPLRSALFSVEQMKEYANVLAKKHALTSAHASEQLLKRLADNENLLLEVHQLLTQSVKVNHRIVPAGEWLLDNFYLIEEQFYIAKKHLPKGYSKGLPQLSKGSSEGLPRVYDIAIKIISHSDGRVDLASLTGFVNAYQTVTKLKLGELWAVPIMLRLALLENLRRLATQIASDILNKIQADRWADEMSEVAEKDPKSLVLVIADMARSNPPMVSSFVAELIRRLQGKGSALTLPLSWIEQRLSENGLTSNELVHLETQKQAADQVSISNSINSLRFLNTTDWREFVEHTSIVEHILRTDRNGIYEKMDFYTRDQYRHSVEKIAKYSNLSEEDIANLAIVSTKVNMENEYAKHVGYFLIGKGKEQIEKIAETRLPAHEHIRKIFNKFPVFIYTGIIIFFSFIFTFILIYKAWSDINYNYYIYIIFSIVCLIGTSQLASTLVNWMATIFARPNLLPRLDFSKGIHPSCRSLVVIPTLLGNTDELACLLESLEVRFLANRDEHLHFALLTDFKDANKEILPGDEELLEQARRGIIGLNKKYNSIKNDIFFLFHRPRKWNEKEKVWMGHERKRGKLNDLNALLRGKKRENFMMIIADESVFAAIKYIITLDTDTDLPRDAAWKMVGTIAHPLNRATYSEKKLRVTEGYSILQPRVSTSLPLSDSSLYAKIHSNEPGTDPYTLAVSDVYQDLFGEGSFIGKGIYEIDAFEQALSNRFPDNRILSHDLLEGCYARCGLISDVQLYEEYPSYYSVDMKRRHRWIRGDWQIARWMLPGVPGPTKRYNKNPLSTLSRWKIFDNLRRSLVPVSLTLILLFGWLFSSAPYFWTIVVIAIITLPSIVNLGWEICQKPKDIVLWQQIVFYIRSATNSLIQHLLYLITLPYEAFINLDAIFRTNWRLFISHKKLLEWNPFHQHIHSHSKKIYSTFLSMWISPLLALCIFIYLIYYHSTALPIGAPVLILWIMAPYIMWRLSKPASKRKLHINDKQCISLRQLARKIWAFFETFVSQEDNWLPPDNYQEYPSAKIAHRTSPTNIGLSLLANLTAYDFGYITMGKLIERTTNTLNTLQTLEKYRGHLYNWYDTVSLLPLHPKYISTVDSGNFMGHLITLKQGLLSIIHNNILFDKVFDGLIDTAGILHEMNKEESSIQEFYKYLIELNRSKADTWIGIKERFDLIKANYKENIYKFIDIKNDTSFWAKKLDEQLNDIYDNLLMILPWLFIDEPSLKFKKLIDKIPVTSTLQSLARLQTDMLSEIKNCYTSDNTTEENEWLEAFSSGIADTEHRAKGKILIIEDLAVKCTQLSNIEYDFLYDRTQHLLAIGYNAEENRRDHSYYDLLASEARLSVFVGIAQGKLPQESWFALGRQLTNVGSTPILLSWSGSMFEYLMPALVMPSYENTLLDQTNKAIVEKQIEYGKRRGVPWGVSESGYNLVDANLNYQYRAFGVPGLGFKRGLGEDLVISPYSSVMALMVSPEKAYENLERIANEGGEGIYGFYEAIDYTASRLPRGQSYEIIRSYMAHHQGMSLLSLSYLLLDNPMQKRFESEVQFQTTLLLLQERIPRVSTFYSPSIHITDTSEVVDNDMPMRVIHTPGTTIPEVQLLSNGRYHVMVTNAGGGYSRWRNISVTRWREDSTCDNWGNFCYIRDLETNDLWSSAYQPILQEGENYEAVFSQGRSEFRRKDHSFETHTEIIVSPEDDVELRRVRLINHSRKRRYIEITSYGEVVLTTAIADTAHPAFSNLFVQTEIMENRNAIVCTRRPRSVDEQTPSMFHLMKIYSAQVKNIAYETDRAQFIGRGNTVHHPKVMYQSEPLSGTQGSVLDPIISIQYRIIIEPQDAATIDMVIGIAETRKLCDGLVEKYQDRHLADRAFELSWTHSQVVLRQINAIERDAQLYTRLAGSVIFVNPSLRASQDVILMNNRGQSGLWGYSISGDLPIVLVQIENSDNIKLVQQLIQAHAYWHLKGLIVDLVIWNEDHGGYRQTLQNQILGLVAPAVIGTNMKEKPGGIFIRSADQISNEDRILFQTVARIVISDRYGTLEEQINRRTKVRGMTPYFHPTKFYPTLPTAIKRSFNLHFFNGTGGFSEDGKEYIITSSVENKTPMPWINVLANPHFGTIVSESGQSYTWLENAHEFRLTPWNNDPIGDLTGEAFYIRDEESGKFWSPVALPSRSKLPYITRHGFGYSVFEHIKDGIYTKMTVFVDAEAAVKFTTIHFHNQSGRPRRLSATGYVEWVLGDIRSKSLMHVITETLPDMGAILARNSYNTEFANKIAFFDVDDHLKTFTTDRVEFIGRNGTLHHPEAMNKEKLSGRLGASLDPCAAIQVAFDIAENEDYEIVFRLGAGKDQEDVMHTIRRFKGVAVAQQALGNIKKYWESILGILHIETPDKSINILANGWLNYQTLACRIWARSGFYQSGGAFGFRDQLQDVISLLFAHTDIVKQQILLSASRQFKEGDVQHWWHPPAGRGVRTTCSDDYLWLPFVVARYVAHTGDKSVLDETVGFLEGRLLNAGEESYYDLPIKSNYSEILYNHCIKSILHALKFGDHGLPLIGSGDWNDGMDKVGQHGKGESVWLAFFLYDVLIRFTEIAKLKGDENFAKKCVQEASQLRKNIEQHGWDGQWYRRAYFDDGVALGSSVNDECKIDSIAQSWSVLSKAADPQRSQIAMYSAYKYLVRKDIPLIQLFDPPFDKSILNPGYIKGYVPGVRENSGQYTHAAIWLAMAFTVLQDKQKTWELLQMINPINHGDTPENIAKYKVEPYVIAADIYKQPLHIGRGGWTWYTGSAGWMYQLIIESFLGLKKIDNKLMLNPCIPEGWGSFKINYRFEQTMYKLFFTQDKNHTGMKVSVDGVQQNENMITLIDDHKEHVVEITF